jgi:CRISPR/Cas system CMR subunit Cmr4 (Cas7 group RAMP superfamily)
VPGRGRVAPKTTEEGTEAKQPTTYPKTLSAQQVVEMTDEQLQAQIYNTNLRDKDWQLVKNEIESRKTRPGRKDTQTRDMIDELESQQLEQLQKADEEAKVRGTREEARAIAEKERLKFESELAELTGALERKQEKTSQDTRLQLLLPIVESDVKNTRRVVVDDADIGLIHDMALYRQSRVKLADNEKKVDGGAFFNVEALPEGSVLVFPIALKPDDAASWQPFGSQRDGELYFGGLESVGFGRCEVSLGTPALQEVR